MARPQGAAGHRTEVVGVRLTAKERRTLITDRKGSLTESAYVRWVLTRAADTDPHSRDQVEVTNWAGDVLLTSDQIDFDDE